VNNIAYYVSGHTAQGKVNLLLSNIVNIDHVISIYHPSLFVKTALFKQLINMFDTPAEILYSPEGKQYLEGVIFRNESLAFIDETLVTESFVERVTNVNVTAHIPIIDDEIERRFHEKIEKLQEKAYENFTLALQIHHDIEQVYIREMDFERANEVASNWKEKLILRKNKTSTIDSSAVEENRTKMNRSVRERQDDKQNRDQTSYGEKKRKLKRPFVYERFFGTNTPDGVVHNVQNIIAPVEQRIFVKGRAGTGKSFFMNELLTTALEKGYTIEKYRCSFDPLSIDMGIIRELNCCFFDSTAPHELFPERESDTIVDLYELTVTNGTDEKYANELKQLQSNYKEKVRAGLRDLRATRKFRDEKEAHYANIKEEDLSFVLNKLVNSKF